MSQTIGQAHLDTAITMLGQGDAAAALRAASDACHEMPQNPRAHYAYGQAWLANGDPARAERAFAAALQLAPEWADAWVNHGVARYQQGAIHDAKTAMQQALLRAPGHAAASSNLAAFMRLTGEAERGEALLRTLVARHPNSHAARLNLVAELLQEEAASQALAMLDEAAPPSDMPVLQHWLLQRSLALLQLKRATEARQVLAQLDALGVCPPELAPLRAWRQILVHVDEGDEPRARDAALRMQTLLDTAGTRIVMEHRIMAQYDLAKFWAGRRDTARAMQHWSAGHALLKLSQPFSRPAQAAVFAANVAAFDHARFASGPRATNTDPTPVFVVGMPRSGTTLCEQILAAHPMVHGAGERASLSQAFQTLAGGEDAAAVQRIAALDTATLDNAAADYLHALHALAPDAARIIDKMPGNYAYLGLVGLLFPAAKIIHCVRDPRDIGLSIFTFRFHGHHPYAHDLRDIGWTIAQQLQLMQHWRSVLPNPILSVHLADWVQDFDGTLGRVLDHLDLPFAPECARFYESESRVRTVSRTQVRRPVNASGLGRWRPYTAELAPLLSELTENGVAMDDGDVRSDASRTS